jgi:lysozyme family protein
MTFDDAFKLVVHHEGGYVNHPNDPGGATRFGVTERVARANGYTGDMREFPLGKAREIYKKLYWDSVRAEELPPAVRFDIFDGAVNSGVSQASKWLQRALGVRDDGVIGPATVAASKTVPGPVLAARYNAARLQFMTDLPNWPSFGRGWARRIAENLRRIA